VTSERANLVCFDLDKKITGLPNFCHEQKSPACGISSFLLKADG
jgi:hypothetical protein